MADMQKLKKAEEEATKMVDAARKDRSATLRTARAEAEAEIKAFRESQLKKLNEMQSAGGKDEDKLAGLEAAAKEDMETLKKDVSANKDKMVERLLQVVMAVDLTVPEARKGIRAK